MKTILISGGGGYLGSYLTCYLLKFYKIIVYDEFYFPWLLTNKAKIKNNNRLMIIKKNILNVKNSDFNGVDVVCDLNGIPNDPASELNKKNTWRINYFGRKKFAEKAKEAGISHYIFNSTCAVYGFNKKFLNEKSKTNPLSTYSKANLKAEKFIYSLKSNNFTVNVLRNSTLYGLSPEMRLDLVINRFVYKFAKEKKIIVDGAGNQWRPFISIKDVARIYRKVIEMKKKSYVCNLVGFNMQIKDIAKKITRCLKTKKNVIKFNKKNFDQRDYKIENTKFKEIFKNFKFSNFNEAIFELYRNFKKLKIRESNKNIRMKFYRKKFLLIN